MGKALSLYLSPLSLSLSLNLSAGTFLSFLIGGLPVSLSLATLRGDRTTTDGAARTQRLYRRFLLPPPASSGYVRGVPRLPPPPPPGRCVSANSRVRPLSGESAMYSVVSLPPPPTLYLPIVKEFLPVYIRTCCQGTRSERPVSLSDFVCLGKVGPLMYYSKQTLLPAPLLPARCLFRRCFFFSLIYGNFSSDKSFFSFSIFISIKESFLQLVI